ncbi:cytochrome c3 family protein [Flavobacterium frigoris]|uniref:Class III cytochrome C family protein n=1 Tax=Flavobacterium frigoris TaxID=229204 RepID=A0A1H9JVW8_FLAFI|nr:cytochrome c3 family protein [Flavobacterium frigoris]SEQ91066.1 Class III cytochrome C family protein [Flavobacterium frigoris]
MKNYLFIAITLVILGLVYSFPHLMISPGNLYQKHSEINNDCFACHKVFSGTPNENCISCHKVAEIGLKSSAKKDTIRTNEILFHKNLQNQDCISCHSEHKGLNSKLGLSKFNHLFLNKNDQKNCVNCHSQPKNELHNQIDNSCVSCHLTSKWKPSTFKHDNYFVLDRNHPTDCKTCHNTTAKNDFKSYSCFRCHEHSINSIRKEHLKEGITNFTNCVLCHKSGDDDDIRMSVKDVKKYMNKELSKNKDDD